MQNNQQKSKRRRFITIVVLISIAFAAIIAQLVQLQLRDGSDYFATAESKKNRTYTLKGERGMILDRNGVVLAYDKQSYDVEFYRDPGKNKREYLHEYSKSLVTIMEIVEKHGGNTVSGFSLKFDEDGEPYFDFLTENAETHAAREELWRGNFYVSKVAIEEIFQTLVERYGLQEYDRETQVKAMSIWQELQMNAFLAKPVKIAINVDFNTVAEIEAAAVGLPGVSIAESTYRVYPRGMLAAHIIGYTGAITEGSLADYTQKGYSADDRVGVTGIEKTMEDQLTGNVSYRQGFREVEVDANGSVTRELSYTPAVDGNNVVLTIDVTMQQILEEALRVNIGQAREIQMTALNEASQEDIEDYRQQIENRDGKPLQLAQTGAAVVMNVRTAEVLAMCSEPGFDPNDFIAGMTTEYYNEKYNIDTAPLFNRAISSKSAPGSVFKMATALAGLMEGVVTVNEEINSMSAEEDREKKGCFIKYGDDAYSPKCWATHRADRHQDMNVQEAVKESCNYYFYNVTDRLGIDTLVNWASRLGLTSKTGIELPNEATSSVGNQSVLYDPNLPITGQKVEKANYVARTIMKHLSDVGVSLGRTFEDERLERTTKELMDLVIDHELTSSGPDIQTILRRELGLSNYEISNHGMINRIISYLRDIKWNANESVLTGIGQSITEVTPVAMARYVSAVANGGTVLQAQIVNKILSNDGAVVMDKTPVVVNEIEGAEAYLKVIRDGMRDVISAEDGGTAEKYWHNYPYKDMIGGKTGTAQINLIDIENSAWFVAFTPFDDPEIAMVVCIQNGYTGGAASMTCQDVFKYFIEKMNSENTDEAPEPGTLVP